MLRYAVLIDAGFVKQKLWPVKKAATTSDMIELLTKKLMQSPHLIEHRLHRVYFYDARPLTSQAEHPNGTVVDFAKTSVAKDNETLHTGLEKSPYVALRFGELVHQGWRIKGRVLRKASADTTFSVGDLEPNIQQKGVDMRIGLDIASLTLKKQVDIIVLVTGDSDFIPAMKFARREGAQLYLVTMGHGVRSVVHQHADLVISEPASHYLAVDPVAI